MSKKTRKLPSFRVSKKGIVTAYISINGARRNMRFNSMKEFESFVEKAEEVRYRINANQYGRVIPFGKVFDDYCTHMEDKKVGSFNQWHRAVCKMPWIRKKPFHEINYDYVVDSHKRAVAASKKGASYRDLILHFTRLLGHLNRFVKLRGGVLGPTIEWMDIELLKEKYGKARVSTPPRPEDALGESEVIKFFQFLCEPIYTEFKCPNNQPNAIVDSYSYKRLRFENWEAIRWMLLVGVSTGFRVGALCALKKKNWNSKKRTILADSRIVNKFSGALEKNEQIELKGLKNTDYREVKITNDLVAHAFDWLCAFGYSEYLFPQLNPKLNKGSKKWQCPGAYSRSMKELCLLAGVQPLPSHKLNRKTYVSLIVYEELFLMDGDMRSVIAKITKDMKWSDENVALRYIVPLYDDLKESRDTLFERIQNKIEGKEVIEKGILRFRRKNKD
jgi:integrase